MARTLTLTFMSGSRDGEVVHLETAGSPLSISIGRVAPCERRCGCECDTILTSWPLATKRDACMFGSNDLAAGPTAPYAVSGASVPLSVPLAPGEPMTVPLRHEY